MSRRRLLLSLITLTVLLDGCTVDISQQVYPTPIALPPASTVAVPNSGPTSLATTPIPAIWSGMNLSGRLVYLTGFQENSNPYIRLQSLDLASGLVTTLYQTPPIWWISAAAVSPDEKVVALSYATPTNYPALYLMPLDSSSAPVPLFSPPTKDDEYIEPVWSPDGKYIYFAHTNFGSPPKKSGQLFPVFDIERIAYPKGAPEQVLTDAYWPRLSSDG
ncbi:MAG TPA: hypothetical protein VMC09_11720, partial [Anaerolineales bacterium]|nr:hypothetical protein [Anaerolineales bacterium]